MNIGNNMVNLFDIECNGLLTECSRIHCISIRNLETNKEQLFTPDNIQEGINKLANSTTLIGHNVAVFDIEVIKRLYGIDLNKTSKIIDTIIMSQVLCTDLKNQDFTKFKGSIDPRFAGSHSLKIWGLRLNCHKGDYQGGFETYNDEMGSYCSTDTAVTRELYLYLEGLIPERTWK